MLKPSDDPAQVLLELQSQTNPRQFWTSQTILVFVAIILVAGILFFWAAYIRKPKRKRLVADQRASNAVLKTSRSGKQRRIRKSRSKRRNPTLADTGGLPPRKQECAVPNSH